jgi:hypothetical protein
MAVMTTVRDVLLGLIHHRSSCREGIGLGGSPSVITETLLDE